MSGIVPIDWCNLCNARFATGKLKAIIVEGGPVEILNVCDPCVAKIPKENWMGKENSHEY